MTNKAEKEFLNEVRPLAEALRDYAMAEGKQYGITDFRIAIAADDKLTNSIEKGSVISVVSGKRRQVAITLYAGDKILNFSKNTLDEETLREAMLKNMQLIHLAPESIGRGLLEKEKVHKGAAQGFDLFDETPVDQKTMIDYAKEAEAAAMAEKGVKSVSSVNVSKTSNFSFVLATNGLDKTGSNTVYSAYAGVVAEDDKGMQVDGDGSVARHFSDMTAPKKLGTTAAKNAVSKLGAVLPDTAVMPVVLDPEAAQQFFGIVYSALDAGNVYKGNTFLKDKLGQQVMSPEITLVDDPAVARGLGSYEVDSVGQKAEKITFIEKGILKCFNASLREARLLGIEPTGRDNGGTTGYTNSTILPGTQTPDELMADIKEGVYVKGFSGGSVNVNNGTHSRQAHGLLIKDGKVTDIAVDGFVVSGNLKDMFRNVAVANDTPSHPNTTSRFAVPTTRINGVTIAGK